MQFCLKFLLTVQREATTNKTKMISDRKIGFKHAKIVLNYAQEKKSAQEANNIVFSIYALDWKCIFYEAQSASKILSSYIRITKSVKLFYYSLSNFLFCKTGSVLTLWISDTFLCMFRLRVSTLSLIFLEYSIVN